MGDSLKDSVAIKNEDIRYFDEFFNYRPEELEDISVAGLQEKLHFCCSESDKAALIKEITDDEIRQTLFSMPKNKASEMRDYRLISCCNVLYQIITKLLVNRLKILLANIIAKNQSAFVNDRLLMENVLLASEVVKYNHKDLVSPRYAMKINISKAFDSVEWFFLEQLFGPLVFRKKFVQVNGELAGYFGSSRGLRQGCSLSPYLFVICVNVLSSMIDETAKLIGYHLRCKIINLTHLCFAHDLLVFVEGRKSSIEGVLTVFDRFVKYSGLRISIEKSSVFLARVSSLVRAEILSDFPFNERHLPVRYLGLSLLTKRLTQANYNVLLERIRSKMNSWTAQYLSYAGRLQLINSVIVSLTNFWLPAFRLPKSCIREIDKLCASFLWSGPDLNPKKSKVSCEVVCTPKREGGLGIKNLLDYNKVNCLKLIWRIVSRQPSLWVTWIWQNIIKRNTFWSLKESTTMGSWMVKKLLKYKQLTKSFHKIEVENGATTSFWFHLWCNQGRLYDLTCPKGVVDLGISTYSTLQTALLNCRERSHRSDLYNLIESTMSAVVLSDFEDKHVWKQFADSYKPIFIMKNIWNLIWNHLPPVSWYKCIWFPHAIPKYSFISWLAIQDRLTTADRMKQ